jgi:hypothetical protein
LKKTTLLLTKEETDCKNLNNYTQVNDRAYCDDTRGEFPLKSMTSAGLTPVAVSTMTMISNKLKGTVSQNFYFRHQLSPCPRLLPQGYFNFFPKIREAFQNSRCITGANNASSELTPSIVDPDGIFTADVIDPGAYTDHDDTSNKTSVEIFSPLSMTSAVTLPPVSLTPVVNNNNYISNCLHLKLSLGVNFYPTISKQKMKTNLLFGTIFPIYHWCR